MSLVRFGQAATPETPAGLLLACHARIRNFSSLAVRLASEASDEASLREAAEKVHRYFTQALPLHVADEERSLAPRLRRFAPEAAQALDAMEREHREHELLLARLVPAWAALCLDPADRWRTHADARRLRDAFEAHLLEEERIVIPALERLPPEEQAAFVAELRARRR